MKRSYSEFREAVEKELKKLQNASDHDIRTFVENEEDEVKYAYERYKGNADPSFTEDARFSAEVSSVAYCLFMMYE